MKKCVIGLVVAVAVGLIALPFALAGPGGKSGNFGGSGYGPGSGSCRGGAQGIQLTPEQTQKIDQLRQKQWEETKGLREELSTKYQELQSFLVCSGFNPLA